MLGMGGMGGAAPRRAGGAPRTGTYNGTMPQLR